MNGTGLHSYIRYVPMSLWPWSHTRLLYALVQPPDPALHAHPQHLERAPLEDVPSEPSELLDRDRYQRSSRCATSAAWQYDGTPDERACIWLLVCHMGRQHPPGPMAVMELLQRCVCGPVWDHLHITVPAKRLTHPGMALTSQGHRAREGGAAVGRDGAHQRDVRQEGHPAQALL